MPLETIKPLKPGVVVQSSTVEGRDIRAGRDLPNSAGLDYAVLAEHPPGTAVWLTKEQFAAVIQGLIVPPSTGLVVSNIQFAVLMENPAGTPVFARLTQDMILAAFTIDSFVPVFTTVVEVGSTIANPAFTATYNRPAVAVTLGDGTDVLALSNPFASFNYGTAPLPARNYTKTGLNQSVTWTILANELNGPIKMSQVSAFWQPRVYFGVAIPGTYNEAFIEGLSDSGLASTFARTIAYAAGGGTQKLYYAFPNAYGLPVQFKDTVTGFGIPFTRVATNVNVTNTFGITTGYDLWESDNFLDAAVTVQVL